MSVADRLNKLSTDITNAYTSIDNKGGTIPSDKNTDNLHTAIDSIEVIEQQTAEGENLSLTNTKAMPYSDYVVEGKSEQDGEPSPSNPSEIHSVADDVNLFDKANYTIRDGAIGFDVSNFEIGKQYTFSSNLPITHFKISDYFSGYNSVSNYDENGFINFTFTMARNSNIPSSATQYLFIALNLSNFITDISDITNYNIKVQKGSTPTPYSPYNQGTVTIKQSGKNYLDWNKFINYSNWSNAESAGYKSFEISGLDTNKIYTLCRVDTAGYGETLKYAGFRNYKDNGNIFLHSTNNSQNLKNISSFPTQDGKIYINMFMNSQNDLNDYIAIIKKCWVIEGTDYEPYQANDYTIQTEPLRSLPNGVKDTIEEEQHRKIGKQTGTLTETTTITLSDAKTNGAYMCNIKPSGTLTGKTIELEAGDYEIIYELAEEVIEPFTQQQATTYLDIIKTGSYENTTNIYTDEDVKPTIGVGYYKKG